MSGPGATVLAPATSSPHLAADSLLAAVLGSADPLASARRRAAELTALFLREQWLTLLDRVERLGPPGVGLPAWLGWRATYALHHLGHLRDAEAVAARVDERVDASSAADLARLYAIRAAVAWSRGEQAAHAHAERAAELDAAADGAARGVVEVALALLSAAAGDREANLRHYERAQAWAEQHGDDLTLERVRNNLASRALEEGDPETAVAQAIAGQQVNLRTGHQSGLALLRQNHAEALVALGRLDEALTAALQARAFYVSAGSPNAGGSWQLVGEIQAILGLATQAAASFRHAIDAAEVEGDVQILVPALAGLALVTAPRDPAGAVALVERIEHEPVAVRGAGVLTAAAWVHLCAQDAVRARACAELAVVEAGKVNDLTRMAELLELLCLLDGAPADDPRLREAAQLRHRIGDPIRIAVHRLVVAHLARDPVERRLATAELRAHGVVADAGQIAGQLHAVGVGATSAPVRIQSLGRFVVLCEGRPIEAGRWPSRKAHEALRLIAAHGPGGLSRARLGELLWPDARDVGNRLSVALSHLRVTLDPGRRHPSDHFLRTVDGRLCLAPERVEHDVDTFRSTAEAALARAAAPDAAADHDRVLAALETAASLYTGPFADGEDGDWAIDVRTELAGLARRVHRALAHQHLRHGTPDAAVPWLTRLLRSDPYDEPDHLAMITALLTAGRYGEARLAHQRYTERMGELGVPARAWVEVSG